MRVVNLINPREIKGNKSMKKQKLAALATASALVAGGAFLGSQALFNGRTEVEPRLSIQTGSIAIDVAPETWVATTFGTQAVAVDGNAFTHAQIGDVFTTDITVTNTGTLNAEVTGTLAQLGGYFYVNGVPFTLAVGNPYYNYYGHQTVLAPNASVAKPLTLTIGSIASPYAPYADNAAQNRTFALNTASAYGHEKSVLINAVQTWLAPTVNAE